METLKRIPVEIETIPALLASKAAEHPKKPAYCYLDGKGSWKMVSWEKFISKIQKRTAQFQKLGLEAGDRLAIMAPPCPEWEIADKAAMNLGAIVVGIDPRSSKQEIEHILAHAKAAAVIDKNDLDLVPEFLRSKMKFILDIKESVDLLEEEKGFEAHTSLDAPATLLYTSGTTGLPKGILYTQSQLLEGCCALLKTLPKPRKDERTICWLPLSGLFQRMINLCTLLSGGTIYFIENPQDIMKHLPKIGPSVFVAVPRFYEKLYAGIQEKLSAMPFWKRLFLKTLGKSFLRRTVAGPRLKFMITGSAPISKHILEFFASLGILVLEAYGVSENTIPIAMNTPSYFKLGSVGKALAANTVKLAEDGEILVTGPALFTGYYQEDSSHAFTSEGYYKTGDYGTLDSEGFLFLKGRKSEVFKTSTGRKIAPSVIEEFYKEIPFIDQIMVVGAGRKHLAGLITLKSSLFHQDPMAQKQIEEEIQKVSLSLPPHQQIYQFAFLPHPFSIQGGELTPTLKLKRVVIEKKYSELISRLYSENEGTRI